MAQVLPSAIMNALSLIPLFEKNGWAEVNHRPSQRTGFKIAVVGSGPAGLSAAWRLNKLGHSGDCLRSVSDPIGGLLMYGIPNMKLDKEIVQRRIDVMSKLGVNFVANTEIGRDITADELLEYNMI